MARVAITEFAAKVLLLGTNYEGISVTKDSAEGAIRGLSSSKAFVVKVDTGLKKRGLQGLVAINIPKDEVATALDRMFELGYERCLVETYIPHEKDVEQYISLELERDGLRVLYNERGGVDIENFKENVVEKRIARKTTLGIESSDVRMGTIDIRMLVDAMQEYHLSFLEVNPFIVVDDALIFLDLAVEIDSAKAHLLPRWVNDHILTTKVESAEEQAIVELNAMSQASLCVHVLNQHGSLLTLLSGGGASLVALDALVDADLKNQIINYSEYSGAPTYDETRVYANELLSILLQSNAEKKAVLIAGGVSNFTDILITFRGIASAIESNLTEIKKQKISFIVRRGGLNQKQALAFLEGFFAEHTIPHEVYGPEYSLGHIGHALKQYV